MHKRDSALARHPSVLRGSVLPGLVPEWRLAAGALDRLRNLWGPVGTAPLAMKSLRNRCHGPSIIILEQEAVKGFGRLF